VQINTVMIRVTVNVTVSMFFRSSRVFPDSIALVQREVKGADYKKHNGHKLKNRAVIVEDILAHGSEATRTPGGHVGP
jgi:hypothetical protein